jgi:hypothetical protein
MNPSKERLLSSIQYATGWLLIFLFGYSFILPILVDNLPTVPLIFPALILTFFTHAALGVRATFIRYHLWRSWLDWVFLFLWLMAGGIFVWVVYLR